MDGHRWPREPGQDDERALALLEEARALLREVGATPHLPPVLCELAALVASRGDMGRALDLYRECGVLLQALGDQVELPGWFEGLAALAARQGQAARAARLWGAAAVLREAAGSPLSRAERGDVDEMMGRSRAQIGDQAWQLAWAAGRAMSLRAALAEALEGSA